MKARLISVLLVIALLVTVGVITVQADNAASCDCSTKKGLFTADAKKINGAYDAAVAMENVAEATTCPYCGDITGGWKVLPAPGTALTSGHYYVDGDMTITAAYDIAASAKVCIHLNNGSITNESDKVFALTKSGTLNIMGEGTVTGAGASAASVMHVKNATVRLMGGVYQHSNSTSCHTMYFQTGKGYMSKGTTICPKNVGDTGPNLKILHSTFTMYGGTIRDGKTAKGGYGGNVLVEPTVSAHTAVFYMYDGEIYGGNAKYGGNIAVNGDAYTVTTVSGQSRCQIGGGKIYNGVATESGGNVYAVLKSKLIFRILQECEHHSQPEVTGGQAATGGNVYVGQLALTGDTYSTASTYIWLRDAKISGGKASNGGNVYCAESKIAVDIGTADATDVETTKLIDGQAKNGGNLFVASGGKATIQYNATLTGGDNGVDTEGKRVASSNGGNIYCAGTLTIHGKVIGGYAGQGGALYCSGSNAVVNVQTDTGEPNTTGRVASIEEGTSTSYGGCVYVASDATFKLRSGEVKNGVNEANDGSCIYGRDGSVQLLGGIVSSNVTTQKEDRQGAVVMGGVAKSEAYPTLVLGGNATVTNSVNNHKENVWINKYSNLVVNAGYTGSVKLSVQGVDAKYGEQFENTSWVKDTHDIDPVPVVSATGAFGGVIELLQYNNVHATFVAEGQGLLIPNAKQNSTGMWVSEQENFADVTLYGGSVELDAEDTTLTLADGATVTAELNGNTVEVNVAGDDATATFKGVNNNTDVAGKAVLNAGVENGAVDCSKWVPNEKNGGYYNIAIETDGGEGIKNVSYHKLEMAMKSISLRPGSDTEPDRNGLYYTTQITTDPEMKGNIGTAGVLLGTKIVVNPETNEIDATKTVEAVNALSKTMMGTHGKTYDEVKELHDAHEFKFVHMKGDITADTAWDGFTSVLVSGILEREKNNELYGQMEVVGVPFVVLKDEAMTVLTAQDAKAYSIKSYLDTAQKLVVAEKFTDVGAIERLKGFCTNWNIYDITSWGIVADGWVVPPTESDETV